jgi:hypothetical protein
MLLQEMANEHRTTVFRMFFNRIEQRVLTLGWSTWRHVVHKIKQKELFQRRALSLLKNHLLHRAMATWRNKIKNLKHYKTIVARVTNKIKHTTLHASVLKWKKVIKTKLLLQRRVRVMIHRWRSNQLRCGWKQWGSYTLQVVQELMETEKKTNTITKIFKKLQNKTLSIALLTWSQRITELRRMEVKKKRLLHRMLYRCANKCFNAW